MRKLAGEEVMILARKYQVFHSIQSSLKEYRIIFIFLENKDFFPENYPHFQVPSVEL